jgi:hypothetical protein
VNKQNLSKNLRIEKKYILPEGFERTLIETEFKVERLGFQVN